MIDKDALLRQLSGDLDTIKGAIKARRKSDYDYCKGHFDGLIHAYYMSGILTTDEWRKLKDESIALAYKE